MLRTLRLATMIPLLFVFLACSHVPQTFNDGVSVVEMREDYLQTHPDGRFNEYIERGEVVRGMNFIEVFASWGIPAARSMSKDKKFEYWSFMSRDDMSGDWTRYMFVFEKGTLMDWEVDKHFAKNGSLAQWSVTEGGGGNFAEKPLPTNIGDSTKR